jgi:hypothetical protein
MLEDDLLRFRPMKRYVSLCLLTMETLDRTLLIKSGSFESFHEVNTYDLNVLDVRVLVRNEGPVVLQRLN